MLTERQIELLREWAFWEQMRALRVRYEAGDFH